SIESYIQTDAVINSGNSGGALVNTKGELIGINTLIISETGRYIGYSFAVPSNIAIKIVNDLKEYGNVQRALLGVSIIEMNADFAKEKNIDFISGVYIESVSDRSSAKEAGLEKGDIITAVDGIAISTTSNLQEQISLHHPGDKIIVTVSRNGKFKDIEVLLKNQQGDTSITKASDYGVLGAGFAELTKDKKSSLGISYGVEVAGVKEGKFEQAGIRKGFIILNINGEIVNNPNDIERIYNTIQNSSNRDKVMFITGMYPNGRSAYYAIDISNN
ncbi:MAG: PDZ domain-containing protein, partial [Paludibacteraceae bacterium]|nr:PDZ domain-containing protein [Paludibacteraceae bacterium]